MDDSGVEVSINSEKIFGYYSNGNVLVKDDPEALLKGEAALESALEYLTDWIRKRQSTNRECIPSTELKGERE